jgi:dienelactone hydrolase
VAAAAPAQYRNPTVGRELSLQIPGMHRAPVQRRLVYRRVSGQVLRMDVYRPRGSRRRVLPAVIVGGPPRFRAGRTSGHKVGWSQAIAASGLVAVTFDHRSDGYGVTMGAPSTDVAAALAYVRAHARRLGIDAARVCTLGFSMGTAPWHLWAAMKRPDPSVRCNVSFYGPLDLTQPDLTISRRLAEEYSALTFLRRDGARIAPMLVAKAGRETNPGFNEAIDRFVGEAARVGAPVRLVTHATGGHAFDLAPRDARSRAIIREALAFLCGHLAARAPAAVTAKRPKPLQVRHRCVTAAERRRAVRFTASDATRLIGVMFGAGPRTVVLAHQGGGAAANLCSWVSYARRLAAAGYRVLAFDHRRFGSSGSARRAAMFYRVDLDVVAAVREFRRRGAQSVVVGGASLGGAAAVAAAASIQPPVQGVISFAAPRFYRTVNAIAAARRLAVPALFVSAVEDEPFATDARALYAAAPSADKRLELFPGFEHGAPVLRDPAARALVDAWIATHSAPASSR